MEKMDTSLMTTRAKRASRDDHETGERSAAVARKKSPTLVTRKSESPATKKIRLSSSADEKPHTSVAKESPTKKKSQDAVEDRSEPLPWRMSLEDFNCPVNYPRRLQIKPGIQTCANSRKKIIVDCDRNAPVSDWMAKMLVMNLEEFTNVSPETLDMMGMFESFLCTLGYPDLRLTCASSERKALKKFAEVKKEEIWKKKLCDQWTWLVLHFKKVRALNSAEAFELLNIFSDYVDAYAEQNKKKEESNLTIEDLELEAGPSEKAKTDEEEGSNPCTLNDALRQAIGYGFEAQPPLLLKSVPLKKKTEFAVELLFGEAGPSTSTHSRSSGAGKAGPSTTK